MLRLGMLTEFGVIYKFNFTWLAFCLPLICAEVPLAAFFIAS